MAQVQITDLPLALPLTGTESVPIVQNGVTVRTTTGNISYAGNLDYPFLMADSTPSLPTSQYLSVSTGLSITDNGPGASFQINMTGAALSLNSSGTGLVVKTGPNTVTGRSLEVGSGLTLTNADGVAGNPSIGLNPFLQSLSSLTGTGVLAIQTGTVAKINFLGVTSQTSITNGDGSGDVTIGLASDPILPGTGSVTLPQGTTAQQPTGSAGMLRYNTTTSTFDGYYPSGWAPLGSGGTVDPATPFVEGIVYGETDNKTYAAPTDFPYNTYAAVDNLSLPTMLTGSWNHISGGATQASVQAIYNAITANQIQTGQHLSLVLHNLTTDLLQLLDVGVITGTYASTGSFGDVMFQIAFTNPSGYSFSGYEGGGVDPVIYDFVIGGTVGENVTLGYLAGAGITTGGENVVVGANAGASINGGANNIVIGNSADVSAADVDNEATFGNSAITTTRLFGAIAFDGSDVGTAGQVPVSQGAGLPPVWSASPGGTVTSITAGTGLTGGTITTSGTIGIDTGVVATLTEAQTLSNKTISGSNNSLSNIGNSSLTYSSITINGNTVSLGGSTTITAEAPNALTIGTGLTGTSYNGSAAVTITIDSSVATLTGSQTLTNKTISGATNTITNIPNASLDYSSITINGSSVSLGGSITLSSTTANALTFDNSGAGAASGTSFNGGTPYTISYNTIGASPLAGSTSFTTAGTITTGTWNATPIGNSYLANSSLTLGTTNIALGGTALTLGGLNSVTVTTGPVADLDLATKQYVDTMVATGISFHQAVKYEVPTINLNATYSNGTAGVGATLTNAGTLTAFTPDGTVASAGDRILVYNQTNQFENGVYTVTTVGNGSTAWVLTRATDADTYGNGPNALDQGSTFFITSGNTGAGESYTCNTSGPIVFGTTAITFAQISDTQIYSAGTGLTLTGTQFSISDTAVTAGSYGSASSVPALAINAQGQITSATNTSIAINGNQITSGTVGSSYISGSYTGITGVGTLTAGTWNASPIANSYLVNSSITINGTTISLGGSGTITAAVPYALTFGTHLTGTSYDGSAAVTIGTDATDLNTPSTIVARDGSGNFSAGTITASLSGNATSATNVAGGAANKIVVQSGSGATTFIDAPTTSSTYLNWTGSSFAWSAQSGSTTRTVTDFTATAGQTTFTASYTVGYLDVYRNGVKLASADVTATNGTSFTISACTAGDVVQSIAYQALGVANSVTPGKSIALAMIFGF